MYKIYFGCRPQTFWGETFHASGISFKGSRMSEYWIRVFESIWFITSPVMPIYTMYHLRCHIWMNNCTCLFIISCLCIILEATYEWLEFLKHQNLKPSQKYGCAHKDNDLGPSIESRIVGWGHPSPMYPVYPIYTSDETLQGRNMSRCSGAF